jgi:ferredoxin, 2Fe-2S
MPRVRVFDRDDNESEIEAPADAPLMYALRDAGLPVEGTCGGYASCGTCHVYVEAEWRDRLDPKTDVEMDMLELLTAADPVRSRLSCQIVMQDALDGLTVKLAPEE